MVPGMHVARGPNNTTQHLKVQPLQQPQTQSGNSHTDAVTATVNEPSTEEWLSQLCVGESMFSWLGRVLKLPGGKVLKRKPHPIGLEAKTMACSMTGMLVDFEFQEGKGAMHLFEFVDHHSISKIIKF